MDVYLTMRIEQLPSAEGVLSSPMPNNWVRCLACGHRCKISPGKEGICHVRYNREGRLLVPKNYVVGLQIDPIEKKPFYHVLPGSAALSFGMLGCDLHCPYCQNWETSQAMRDPEAGAGVRGVEASEIVQLALEHRAPVITSTYNEPLITAEWSADIFALAHEADLLTSYVSNGNGTPEVMEYLAPHLDMMKIDLKGFRQKSYAALGGILQNVLDTIVLAKKMDKWVEIVTLLIPGFNDDEIELRELAQFLASVSVDIPWHVTAFHPDYKMTENRGTTAQDLVRAAGIGREAGLRYVYAGNLPGMTGGLENTHCPSCGLLLIERFGFHVRKNKLAHGSTCPSCGTTIAGIFGRPEMQKMVDI